MAKTQSIGSRIKTVELSQVKAQLKDVSEELFNQAKINRNLTTLLAALVKQQEMATVQLTDESLADFFRATDQMSDNDYAPRIKALRELFEAFGITGKPQCEVSHDVLLSFDGYDVRCHVKPDEERKRQIITMSLAAPVNTDTLRKITLATPEEVVQMEKNASREVQ